MMMDRPSKAIKMLPTVNDVRAVRAREQFVPGFTNNDDPTHLTTGFLKMTALCGHYPVEFCGDSPSGRWCEECLEEAENWTR